MPNWTPQVSARAELAERLGGQPDRVRAGKLKGADLALIAAKGREAEAADQEQTEQLTAASVAVTGRKEEVRGLLRDDRILRDVVLATVDDLEETEPAQARYLARLSFSRYRVRELQEAVEASGEGSGAAEPTSEEREEIKSVQLVQRADQISRARSLGRFCRALLKPGREPIVAALAERDITDLAGLAARAEAVVEAGRNVMTAAEATKREPAAVAAQTKKWTAVRRLIRRAVKGDSDLERALSAC